MTTQPAKNAAVICRDIWKSFGEETARIEVLRGVDFRAQLGELSFINGPSGCGKTTLLCVIAGLLNANRGSVELFGENVAGLPGRERIEFRRRHLGFVFQQCNLLPALTAAENAAVPLLAAGWKRSAAVARGAELLVQLGLEARVRAFPPKLSGGEQQRVALARALVHRPRLVICDESTAALDHAAGESVMELLASAALQPDSAVIVVTHDTRVFRFANTIAHLEDGRIVRAEKHAP